MCNFTKDIGIETRDGSIDITITHQDGNIVFGLATIPGSDFRYTAQMKVSTESTQIVLIRVTLYSEIFGTDSRSYNFPLCSWNPPLDEDTRKLKKVGSKQITNGKSDGTCVISVINPGKIFPVDMK